MSFVRHFSHCMFEKPIRRTLRQKMKINTMANLNDNLIDKIVSLMQKDNSFDAPKDAIQWSKNIFRSKVSESKKSLMQKVLAVLQMDLKQGQPAFGERSASASKSRQMLFQAGEISIDIRITNDEIKGQILALGFENSEVMLGEFSTKVNELSEFTFSNIPNGSYDLILKNSEKEITIEIELT
jgi:hypothetical protein